MKMNKKISIIFSVFFIAFLLTPSLASAGTCTLPGGSTITFVGTEAEQKYKCENYPTNPAGGGAFTSDTTTGGGSEEEVCPTCPAGTVCFQNPISACSVKKFVTNLLGRLQGIIALIAIVVIVIGGIMYMASFGNEEAMKKAKAVIGAALIGLALTLAAPSFIKEILTILEGSNVNPGDVESAATIEQILLNVLKFLLSIAGIIATIVIVIGGQMYLTSGGDEEAMKKAKSTFIYAVIGIIVVLAALVLVNLAIDMFTIV